MISFRLVVVSLVLLNSACSEQVKRSYKVTDGDSFTVIDESTEQLNKFYELAYLDAPEREQPYGREAKQYLKDVLLNDKVTIKIVDGYTVELFINGQSVNLEMVNKGYAWASLKIPDSAVALRYIDAQKYATENLQGVWSLGHGLMIAPWQWRAQGQEKTPSMNYQKQLMLKRKKDQQAQKEAAIKRQREYAKRRMLQQQKNKATNVNKTDKD